MKGTGKYFDGVRPLSYHVSFGMKDDVLMIFEEPSLMLIAEWPMNKIIRDENQNVVIVLKLQDEIARLEIDGIPAGLENFVSIKMENNRRLATISALVGSMILIIGLVWIASPLISQFIAKSIPIDTEKNWSLKIFPEKALASAACIPSFASQAALNKIISRLYPLYPGERAEDFPVSVDDSPMDNAFTFPGGRIILMRGIIDHAESAEEIAGILSHELAHAKERHILSMLIRSSFFAALFHFIGGDFSGAFIIEPSTIMSVATLSFSRKMEEEADLEGMKRLAAARISKAGFEKFLQRMSSGGPDLSFLSTHPQDQERIKALANIRPYKVEGILNESEWKAIKSYCSK